MRTELSTIGKENALNKLFENTQYINNQPVGVPAKGECICSHKIMLEGVDFDLVFNPLKHLGYKAVLYAIGELYAKFHTPVSLSVNLGISRRFCFEDIQDLFGGMIAAAQEHKIEALSLDMNPSINGLCISISACGVQKKGVLEKIPASKNVDLICISGNLGAAYMGFHVLQREKVAFNQNSKKQPDLTPYKYVLESYLSPHINPNLLERFKEEDIYPSNGYFITKGLGAALLTLSRETSFGTKVFLDKIPISSGTFAVAEEINIEATTAAMNGGDDFKFLFTLPIEHLESFRKNFADFDVIGHLTKGENGNVLIAPSGAEIAIKAQGFNQDQEN